jgi:chromosome segregation ATPase
MHSGGIAKTLEFIFGEPVEFTGDFTYDSVNITSGQTKPPFEEFMKIYDKLAPLYELRIERNQKLAETDWTQTNDIRLENEEEWVAYRQALRDLPSLETPIWSEQPQVKIVKGKNIRTELSDTKADLSETKTNLQTTQTELADAKTDLEEKTYQIISLEARLAALEQKFISN